VSTVRVMTSGSREWDRGPMALDGLTGLEIDLRLSAGKVTIGHAKIGRTAVAASLRGGKLLVTVGEAQAYGGVIRGSLALAKAEGGAEIKSEMQLTDVDLDACMGELFGLRRLEGKGTLSFALEGAGESVLALTRNLSGTVNLTAEHGAIAGINVEQVLRRLERRPLSPGDYRSGRTPFDKLTVALKVANGEVSVADATVDSTTVRIAMVGTALIPTRELDLRGTAALLNGPNEVSFELPFMVSGPWDSPLPLPDTAVLIQRSGPAAQLLDAARDRKNRDAIRSALDRLMGPKPASVPTATAAPAGQ
jgi:AsmA protein